MKVSREICLTF